MSRAMPPPPPPRRRFNDRTEDYRYEDDERCKMPIELKRRIGNKTRITISSAQDGYKSTGVNYVSLPRISEINPRRQRTDYRRIHRRSRSRSRSSSRDRYRRRADSEVDIGYEAPYTRHNRRGSSDSRSSGSDEASTLEFDFDLDLSDSSTSKASQSDLTTVGTPLHFRYGGEHVLAAGNTSNLILAGSRWLGSTFDSWDLGVELTTSPVAPHSRHLMTWHHMERPNPTFDEFVAVVRRELQQTSEGTMRRVEKMLRKLQAENEKQRQQGREMVPICMSDVEYQNDGTNDKQKFSATFSTFPFFSLEMLSNNNALSPNAAHHPARPLLQTYTRTVNNKRELSQVVTTRSSTPNGHSLHVSSVWCLIVNDKIITCSSISLEGLRQDFSSVVTQAHATSSKAVNVTIGNVRSWSFPVDKLRSWSSLVAMFANDLSTIGDRDAEVTIMHEGRSVDAKIWPRVVSNSKFPLQLVLKNGDNNTDSGLRSKLRSFKNAFIVKPTASAPQSSGSNTADVAAIDGSKDQQGAASKTEINSRSMAIPGLHIFQRESDGSSKPLSALADVLHETLATHPQDTARLAYQSCPEVLFEGAQAALLRETKPLGVDTKKMPTSAVSDKFGQIALLAEYIFTFFWPADYDHVMVRRFRGAVYELVDLGITGSSGSRSDAKLAADIYYELYHRILPIVAALTTSLADSEASLTTLPNQFREAWLHFLSAFVLLRGTRLQSNRRHATRLPTEQLKLAARKLEAGQEELVNRLRVIDAEDYEVCSSTGIVALLLNRLSRDMIREGPDVAEIYGDFCQQLDAKILESPLTRTHQATIRDLQQELEAVLRVLTQQADVINVFERSIQAQDEDIRLPYLPILLDSRQEAVLATCKNTLAARIDRIKALQARATELGEWHLGEIANNKDRQEAAIMVFTIVTIIFLPLSFVSSVFGMNSSDIRDMDFGQWLYWVVAIPLTIVVIAASLYFAGALSDWHIGFPNKSKTVYQHVAADQPVRAAAMRGALLDAMEVEKPRRRTTYPARRAARDYV